MNDSVNLVAHDLRVALLQPQIAPNTGNIARLCVATGTQLHLVRPMGFVLSDRNLKRSGMDYWPQVKLTVHETTEAFLRSVEQQRVWAFSSKASRSHWQADYRDGDTLIFGNETHGIGPELLEQFSRCALRIPQAEGQRCLNLSTAAGIGLFEALRVVIGGKR